MRHHLGADYSTPNPFVAHQRNEALTEPHHPVVRAVLDSGIQFAHTISDVGKSALIGFLPHRSK